MTAWEYRWAESVGLPSLPGRKGERCEVVVRAAAKGGPRNVWVRFEDGFEAVVSWRSVRRSGC